MRQKVNKYIKYKFNMKNILNINEIDKHNI